jgi:LmbE family N-acetylglucosaminyl deacetylase
MESPEALVARLAREIADFVPTHVVLPCADDRHPDHNSAAVAAALAFERVQARPETLAYLVHGAAGVRPGFALALDPEQRRSSSRPCASMRPSSRCRGAASRRWCARRRAFYADVFTDTTRAAPDLRVRATGDALELELEPSGRRCGACAGRASNWSGRTKPAACRRAC